MRENRTSGSVRGVLGNRCSYREMAYMKGDVMQKVIVFVFFSMVLFCNCGGSDGGSDSGSDPQNTVSEENFVGTWIGTINMENEDRDAELTINDVLEGTFIITGSSRTDLHDNIDADYSNEFLTFDLPVSNSDEGHPDCINWSVECEATLSNDLATMDLFCEGIVCGDGGGQDYNFTIDLVKQ
jgi:hypothetical protein